MPATAKKLHWTQRPENKDKLHNLGRHAVPKTLADKIEEEYHQLKEKAVKQIAENAKQMETLQLEREKLESLLKKL